MPLLNRDGVDIWYETTGDGSPLVLIHANPFDHDLWLYQTAHFSTWFRVIGVDIRGYGRSSKVATPFTLKDMKPRKPNNTPAATKVAIADQGPVGQICRRKEGLLPDWTPALS